jgi:prevent-host-death family protein
VTRCLTLAEYFWLAEQVTGTEITKHGRPAVVMLSLDDLESLEETLEILSDRGLMDAIGEAEADVMAGRLKRPSKEEVLASVKRR